MSISGKDQATGTIGMYKIMQCRAKQPVFSISVLFACSYTRSSATTILGELSVLPLQPQHLAS